MIFLDTSVFVAASVPSDPRQERCLDRLAIADRQGGACATHTLSEIFASLTRLPLPYRVPAQEALRIVLDTSERFSLVTLTVSEHLHAIRDFVALGLTGAMVYDALLLASARKVRASRIFTLNPRHFRLAAPDLAAKIVEP